AWVRRLARSRATSVRSGVLSLAMMSLVPTLPLRTGSAWIVTGRSSASALVFLVLAMLHLLPPAAAVGVCALLVGSADGLAKVIRPPGRTVPRVPALQPGQGHVVRQVQVADQEAGEVIGHVMPPLAFRQVRQAAQVGGGAVGEARGPPLAA